jgi:cell division protein FtsW
MNKRPGFNEVYSGNAVKKHQYYDWSLVLIVIFLLVIGILMLYSASYYAATKYYHDPMLNVRKQITFALIGLVFMIIISRFDYHLLIKPFPAFKKINLIRLGYILCLVLQVAVLFASAVSGSERWIEIGPIKFQPSELTKILVLIYSAYFAYAFSSKAIGKLPGIIYICIILGPLILLVAFENLSTGIIIFAIMFTVCFIASKNKYWWFLMLFAGGIAGAIFIKAEKYRMDRFKTWLNFETDPKGYQIRQGLYAIASGGFWGKGFGQGTQKLGYIVEAHTDYIFTIVCEELGFIGALAVIVTFVLLLWRMYIIAVSAPDRFGAFLCVGVMVHIAVQVLLNIAVATNTIPSTGVTLPFFSYGGTSLFLLLCEIGLVLSVSNSISVRY